MPILTFRLRFLASLLATALFMPAMPAVSSEKGTVAYIIDNDLFAGTDEKYTNGLRLSWLGASASGNSSYSKLLRDSLDFIPAVRNQKLRHSAAISLTQIMSTPTDITATELLPDQAPYFGYLELATTLYAWDANHFTGYGLAIGVIGPDSGADRTQRFVHRLLGAQRPQGWQNQIGRRYTAEINYSAGSRIAQGASSSGLGWDLNANYSFALGTPLTQATGGAMLRWGRNLPRNFNTYFADSGGESALLGLADKPHRSGWMLYAGLAGTATAYNAVQRAARHTHNFDYQPFTATFIVGASVSIHGVHVGLSLQADTSPVKQDRRPISYGSLYLIWPL